MKRDAAMKAMRAALALAVVVGGCWVYADDPATFELLDAKERGDVEGVKAAVENGAYMHAEGMFGETALMLAVRDGELEVVKLLIEAGADPDATGGGSQSALDWARAYQKKDVQELLEHYASQRQQASES
ncbi:MAG: ankyrin repeat domain-containing protein [Spirochaetota bacterium]